MTSQHELFCFGANERGQLGDGTTQDRDGAPAARVWLLSGRGDPDCDETISSIDALFVLELVARLKPSLPCTGIGATAGQDISR